MYSVVKYDKFLQKAEKSPTPFLRNVIEVWGDIIESYAFSRQYNGHKFRKQPKNRLPTMLRTLANRYSPGGILCEIYRKLDWPLEWKKGYNGFIAVTDDETENQVLVPKKVLEWATGKTLSEDEVENLQAYIHQVDRHVGFHKMILTRRKLLYRFGFGSK